MILGSIFPINLYDLFRRICLGYVYRFYIQNDVRTFFFLSVFRYHKFIFQIFWGTFSIFVNSVNLTFGVFFRILSIFLSFAQKKQELGS